MFGWLKNMMGGAREPALPPIPQEPLTQAELIRALKRHCAPLMFRKPATIDPFATMFGAVRLERNGEVWPSYEAAPLWPVLQLNLREAPVIPEALRDLSLLTVFVAPDHTNPPTRMIDTGQPDPMATWAIRSYSTLEALTIPKAPKHGSNLRPQLGEWAPAVIDYANDDVAEQVTDTVANDLPDHERCEALAQTKLGGWPATSGAVPWWDREPTGDTWDFVLQIGNEPKAGWHGWGDGTAFIARSRERPHIWAIDVQVS